jgi:hypothetical protein
MLNRVRCEAEATCWNVHEGIFSSKDNICSNYQVAIFCRVNTQKYKKQIANGLIHGLKMMFLLFICWGHQVPSCSPEHLRKMFLVMFQLLNRNIGSITLCWVIQNPQEEIRSVTVQQQNPISGSTFMLSLCAFPSVCSNEQDPKEIVILSVIESLFYKLRLLAITTAQGWVWMWCLWYIFKRLLVIGIW